ncbi:MAG: substrate-binding domain-containing protein [Oscillospiraceae bacterium]|jgi:phosphate transport system substrate-binding protein|nr:substrate-binding domain-containing protein [Oscillospiraceae bacterium]
MKKRTLGILALALALALALTACAGGATGFDKGKNITIVAREDGSGTKTAFMEIIGLKGKADPAGAITQTGTAAVLEEVKGNPAAIAYESLGYVTGDVKKLTVDGVEATVANIQSGSYKISRPLSVVYKAASLDSDVNAAFFAYLGSSDAQAIITAEGYVSLYGSASAYTVNGSLSGTIGISGSTSLKPLMDKLAAAFEGLQDNVKVTVAGGGSGQGYKDAEGDVSEFGMISEEFNTENAPSCTHYVVCKDGIAVIVNPANTLTNITMAQLKTIYNEETASAPKWSDIG